ncbi:MAG: FtsX-like permease family protein [Bacteroidales bacterium]|nr:FtsX-like permease family protein [Bacteroidales bacterium]MCF8389913.1 FtsX-like permease family protein [Bacteroidales bacterium]
MLAFKLAFRNLMGAGLRTWLNVIILSLAFVMIIWFKGMLDGWDREAKMDSIAWEYGGGEYWQKDYDPLDAFTLTESHSKLNRDQLNEIDKGNLIPVLISQGTIYPDGRMQTILIKGIDKNQSFLKLPTARLDTMINEIPAIIGANMAKTNRLEVGDIMTLRWRDVNGTFDANEIQITDIFQTNVPSVDGGQIWIDIDRHREMMLMPDEATILVCNSDFRQDIIYEGWDFKDLDFLLKEIDEIIKTKSIGGSTFYFILLMLAWLAIFDTQVLSIFRRQKEIGTYIAMGMTKRQVVGIFTVEGAMHSILAVFVGSLYGIPLFWQQASKGINFGMDGSEFGITMAETLYPYYTLGLVVTTIIIVVLTTTLVSYLPAKKISKMNPTEALKGKTT